MSHILIVGGGIGGLLTAAAVAPHVDQVTIVERDPLDHAATPRAGTPQARHVHGLLASGRAAIAGSLPGVIDDLIAQGALADGDLGVTGRWYIGGGLLTDCHLGQSGMAVSRTALETTIRRHVRTLRHVEIRDATAVTGLHVTDGRVDGVLVRHRDDILADLVVDSSGRTAACLRWLSAAGLPVPDEDTIRLDLWYATTRIPRHPTDLEGRRVVISAATADVPRGGVAIAHEDGTWKITLFGYGQRPPIDPDGLRDYAHTIVSPDLADLLAGQTLLDAPQAFSIPTSRRRRFERLPNPPRGYLAIADALANVDPALGQGMSVAALQATRLGALIGRYGIGDTLTRPWYRAAGQITDRAWVLTAGADLTLPGVSATVAPGPAWVGRYIERVQLAARHDPAVARAFLEVTNLLKPAPSLLRPQIAVRTLLARPPDWPRSLRSRRPQPPAPAAPAPRSSPAPR